MPILEVETSCYIRHILQVHAYAHLKTIRKSQSSVWMQKATTVTFACRLVRRQTCQPLLLSFARFIAFAHGVTFPEQHTVFLVPTSAEGRTVWKNAFLMVHNNTAANCH